MIQMFSQLRTRTAVVHWCLCLLAALSLVSAPAGAAADQPAATHSTPAATNAAPSPEHDVAHDASSAPGPSATQATSASTDPDSEPHEQPIVTTFLRIGFNHIIPEGLDHILFVVGLYLLAPRFKPLLIQVTAFTVAHSITLGLCMADIVHLPSRLVETTIAASIAFVAIENICYKELKPWRWMVVFCFGLIHGLGFASALKELGLPPGHFFPALISFNVGVEAGQLTVIAVAAALTVWFWKKPWYRARIVIPCSVVIAGIGLFWAGQRALGYGG